MAALQLLDLHDWECAEHTADEELIGIGQHLRARVLMTAKQWAEARVALRHLQELQLLPKVLLLECLWRQAECSLQLDEIDQAMIALDQHDARGRIGPLGGGDVGEDATEHPVGGPGHRGDGGDPELLVDHRAPGVVDAGDHALEAEHLPGGARHHDVRVVPVGDGRQRPGFLDAGLAEFRGRFQAAMDDATVAQVRVVNVTPGAFEDNAWVEVTGTTVSTAVA